MFGEVVYMYAVFIYVNVHMSILHVDELLPLSTWMFLNLFTWYFRIVNGHIVGVPNYPTSRTAQTDKQAMEGLDTKDGQFKSHGDNF